MLLKDYAEAWIERPNCRRSRAGYRAIWNCRWTVLGDKDLADITKADIHAVLAGITSSHAPNTRGRALSFMRALMNCAVEDAVLKHSPVPRIRGLNVDADPLWRDRARYCREDLDRLVTYSSAPMVTRLAIEWMGRTACRISELSGASWASIDLSMRPLPAWRVSHAYVTSLREVCGTKTGAPRAVPLTAESCGVLYALMHEVWPSVVGRAPRPSDPLFPVVYGGKVGRLRNDRAGRWLKCACARSTVKYRGLHTIRASAISMMIEGGAPLEVVEAISHGRTSAARAIYRYVRIAYPALCDAVSRIKLESAADPLPLNKAHVLAA